MPSVVKLLPKGEVGVCALNIYGNYIVDHGKSWKNHGILFLNSCGDPVVRNKSFRINKGGLREQIFFKKIK